MENNLRDSLIQDWIIQGDSLLEIVKKLQNKEIPTAKKTVSKVLKNKGFTYNKSTKEWLEPLSNANIIDSNINRGPVIEKMEIKKHNTALNLPDSSLQLIEMLGFSQDEFIVLKGIISNEMNKDHKGIVENSLHDDISKLKTFSDRKNKTFYASEGVVQGFAAAAEKNGLKTSVAIELAMLNFIEKYSK